MQGGGDAGKGKRQVRPCASRSDKKEAARPGGLLILVHASARVAWPRVQKAWRREMAPETSGISPVLDPNAEKLSIVVGVSLWSMSRP